MGLNEFSSIFLKPGIRDDRSLRVVCGTETSTTIRWSPNSVSLPCFAECRWCGCNRHGNRDWGLLRQSKVSNLLACLLNPLTSHSAMQRGEERSGVIAVPLVSVLQTCSSRMFVFKVYLSHSSYQKTTADFLRITLKGSMRVGNEWSLEGAMYVNLW